ncbi:dipeptide epimerase [Paucibacter sp. R3-3]|uniref:Dipeptide epimerase n=1 Tax=Roseateles agri TaxID=3098619 RepID=A0ABU5DCD7_9BURK|nr:dipeptide epimerase [Paucibacter sp. R3-3]MDY0743932.1 dipeptide epimerase [Paucibacter sp. R3-3]
MPLALAYRVEALPLREPFQIAGHRFVDVPVLQLRLRDGPYEGRSEAAGVYYLDDRPPGMARRVESVRAAIEAGGFDRQWLRSLLPPGGARNALDCALWALEASRAGVPVWQLAGLPGTRPLQTTFTLGAAAPEAMAAGALAYAAAGALKLKLTGEGALDVARVRAVRAARPDAWLGVDANQGYALDTIAELLPALVDCGIALLEQPFARGREQDMRAVDFPVPTAADESCLDLAELERIAGLFDMVNIKLDKCGGLTEGLMIARRARELGLQVMVGNMGGSSLAMAPAFVLGQLCDVVDLDGPTILAQDCTPAVAYRDGCIDCDVKVWA